MMKVGTRVCYRGKFSATIVGYQSDTLYIIDDRSDGGKLTWCNEADLERGECGEKDNSILLIVIAAVIIYVFGDRVFGGI